MLVCRVSLARPNPRRRLTPEVSRHIMLLMAGKARAHSKRNIATEISERFLQMPVAQSETSLQCVDVPRIPDASTPFHCA
jgi:hypothetical protein